MASLGWGSLEEDGVGKKVLDWRSIGEDGVVKLVLGWGV